MAELRAIVGRLGNCGQAGQLWAGWAIVGRFRYLREFVGNLGSKM